MIDLRSAAHALGGEVSGRQVLFPPPGHSRRDRSASLRFDPRAPGGFLVHSFAGENPLPIRDYVRGRLPELGGLSRGRDILVRKLSAPGARVIAEAQPDLADAGQIRAALRIWSETSALAGTLGEQYLATRLVEAGDAADVRFHSACPWRLEDGSIGRVPALVVLLRDIKSNEPCGVQRTGLRPDGTKNGRRMFGRASGAAIKLDVDEDVHGGLTIGEGLETVLTARQLGLGPAWALGSAGAIAGFPVLPGIEAITTLEEVDDSGASARAVEQCGTRWHEAGREVLVVRPKTGSDLNDAIREVAR